MKRLVAFLSVFVLFYNGISKNDMPEKLSDFGFFEGELKALKPKTDVMPYELAVPLFSDYAVKKRFIKLPENQQIIMNDTAVLAMPVGTYIIKNFLYPIDFRDSTKGQRIMETRVLERQTKGWRALEYVWNDAQTEAYLEVAGDTKPVSFTNLEGKKISFDYTIPNLNQCKGCHNRNEVLTPIGPSARQLGTQVEKWHKMGLVDRAYTGHIYENNSTLDQKARAWLDINCAHCHYEHGAAKTSGLLLDFKQTNQAVIGVLKTPVAAGRASEKNKYDIVPGKPKESILYNRLVSTDPGQMMPELGRKLRYMEGEKLIYDWIKAM